MSEQNDILERRRLNEQTRTDVRELRRDVRCLHDSFQEFRNGYEPLLKQILEDHHYWYRVREHVVAGTAKGLVWVLIVGFAVAIWHAMSDYIIQLVSRDK